MKKTLIFLIILLINSTIISCGTPATATPIGTVNAYLGAGEAKDSQALVSYETEMFLGITRAERLEHYATKKELVESHTMTNLNLAIESETASTATVSAVYDLLTIYVDDTERDEHVDIIYVLTKVNDKWLISDISLNR